MKKTIFILLTFHFISISIAQVGIQTVHPKATLDIKNNDLTNFAVGIIAPQLSRAQLTSKDDNYDIEHKSTMVYVNSIDGIVSQKTEYVTKNGYYIFNGTQWKYAEEKLKYFILPAFKLKIDPTSNITTGLTFDIYNEVYKKQLTKQGTGDFISNNPILELTLNKIYQAEELDYVISFFDTNVLENIVISPSGIMTYDIKSYDLNINSFINMVLVVKE